VKAVALVVGGLCAIAVAGGAWAAIGKEKVEIAMSRNAVMRNFIPAF
jgi:hypothetical protein